MTPPRDLPRAVRAARDGRAMARRARRGRGRPSPRFRFPCGHVEGRSAVNRRLRITDRAAWVRCRSCNLVALVVARPAKAD